MLLCMSTAAALPLRHPTSPATGPFRPGDQADFVDRHQHTVCLSTADNGAGIRPIFGTSTTRLPRTFCSCSRFSATGTNIPTKWGSATRCRLFGSAGGGGSFDGSPHLLRLRRRANGFPGRPVPGNDSCHLLARAQVCVSTLTIASRYLAIEPEARLQSAATVC